MKPLLAACAFILFAFSSGADDGQTIVTTKGVRYEKAVVTGITPATATLTHAEGVVTVPMWELPRELQLRYGYDPAKAAARLKSEADARSAAAAAKKHAEQVAWTAAEKNRMNFLHLSEGSLTTVYDPETKRRYEGGQTSCVLGF